MPEGMLTGASCHQTHRDYGSDAPAVNSASTTLMLKRLERGGAPSASAFKRVRRCRRDSNGFQKARSSRHSNHFPRKAL